MNIMNRTIEEYRSGRIKCVLICKFSGTKHRIYSGFILDSDETALIFEDKFKNKITIAISEVLEVKKFIEGGHF